MARTMSDSEPGKTPVRLLWTGGWDSTYRLLELLLVKRKPVQPYYFIDTDRRSFPSEIRAMNAIKRRLDVQYPDLSGLLQPTIFRDVLDIPPDEEIQACYRRICAWEHIGVQYEWGARFARSEDLTGLELSLIGGGHMFKVFEPYLDRREVGGDTVCEIGPEHEGADLHRLFNRYRFPLIFTTKQDMLAKAREAGFAEFLLLTVFCHSPRRDGKPCGICIPCGIAEENGLGWRLPPASRAKMRLQKLYRKGRAALEKYPLLFSPSQKIVRKLKTAKKGRFPVP
jgi:hypothetical protein